MAPTLTDGAMRMLVLLHFYELGYSPLQLALLFLFYELVAAATFFCRYRTGAWVNSNRSQNLGRGLQLVALTMLLVPASALTMPWVMAAQALSGVARGLHSPGLASAVVKPSLPANALDRVYKLLDSVTGSTNTLKAAGYIVGGALLTVTDFRSAVGILLVGLAGFWIASLLLPAREPRKAQGRPLPLERAGKNAPLAALSIARVFLTAARDIWFVIALPVHLLTAYAWSHLAVVSFLALWIIVYAAVRALALRVVHPAGYAAARWTAMLALVPLIIAVSPGAVVFPGYEMLWGFPLPELSLIGGLLVFAVLFALCSNLNSQSGFGHACGDGISPGAASYSTATALGRLAGTFFSGWVYQSQGLAACLLLSGLFLALASTLMLALPGRRRTAGRVR